MSLIVILLCLAIEHFFGNLDAYRQFAWFNNYSDWMLEKLDAYSFREGPVAVLMIIAVITIPLWIVFYLITQDTGLFNLLGMLFSIATILYCLGPRDPERQVKHYLDAMENTNYEAATLYAGKFLNEELSEHPAKMAQMVKQGLLIALNDRIIGVFFWFIVLGPVGVVLFRLSCLLKEREINIDNGFSKAVHDLYSIMIWPSARLCLLGYAIAGSFVGALSHLQHFSDIWKRGSTEMLIMSGLGAMHDESYGGEFNDDDKADLDSIKETLSLNRRTIIALLAILAMLTIAGWLV